MTERVRPLSEGNTPFADKVERVKEHKTMFSEAVDQDFLTALIHVSLEWQDIETKYNALLRSNRLLSSEKKGLKSTKEAVDKIVRTMDLQAGKLKEETADLKRTNETLTNDLQVCTEHETRNALRIIDLENTVQKLKATNITLQLKNDSLETKNKKLEAIAEQCEKRKAVLGSVSTLRTNRRTGIGHYFDIAKKKLKNPTKLEYQRKRAEERATLELEERKQALQLAFNGSQSTSNTPLLVKAKRIRNPLNADELKQKELRDKYRQIKKTKGIRKWTDVRI